MSRKPLEVYIGGDGFAIQAFWRSGVETDLLDDLEMFVKAVKRQAERETARRVAAGIEGGERP